MILETCGGYLMFRRNIALSCLILSLALSASADTLTLKDGTKKTVRIYKVAKEYVSYLADGQIHVVSRDALKDYQITETKPISPEELAAAVKKTREALRRKVREQAGEAGKKPEAPGELKTIEGGKGVEVIEKGQSKTRATELKIDPFPEIPVKGEAPRKPVQTKPRVRPVRRKQ
jgi:hypothetical protein